jgi:hypothetical protein
MPDCVSEPGRVDGSTRPFFILSDRQRRALESRRKQIAQCLWLRARIDADLASGDAVVVMGDLNVKRGDSFTLEGALTSGYWFDMQKEMDEVKKKLEEWGSEVEQLKVALAAEHKSRLPVMSNQREVRCSGQ